MKFSMYILILFLVPAQLFSQVVEVQNSETPETIIDIARFEPDLILGSVVEDTMQQFYRLEDVKVDRYGNIFTLERSNCQIKKFDKTGNFKFFFGRKGQGPAEFMSPQCMALTAKNEILILDAINHRISIFDSLGTYINSFRTKNAPIDLATNDGDIWINEYVFSHHKVATYNFNGQIKQTFGDISEGKNKYETYALNKGFISYSMEGKIYLSVQQPYRIEEYDDNGELCKLINREVGYKVIKPDLEAVEEKNSIIVKNNFYTKISVDLVVRNGKIYHLVRDGHDIFGQGSQIDVFNSVGKFIACIKLKNEAKKFDIDDRGCVYLIIEPIGEVPGRKNSEKSPRIEKYTIDINA